LVASANRLSFCGGVVAASLVLFRLRTFSNVCDGARMLLKMRNASEFLNLDIVGVTSSILVPPTTPLLARVASPIVSTLAPVAVVAD
jgi:hypothetical protein